MVWSLLMYFIFDILVAFFLGVIIGVVAVKMAGYLVALLCALGAATLYFERRGLFTIYFQNFFSSIRPNIILNYHTYGMILGVVFGIGFVVGLISGIKGRKKRKEAVVELS